MQQINHSTLRELHYFDEGYKIKRMMDDEKAYLDGYYTYEAVAIAVGNAFRGKGQKPMEYRKKPILQEIEENNHVLTEEEIQKQRDLFVESLKTMKTNFDLSKKKAEG